MSPENKIETFLREFTKVAFTYQDDLFRLGVVDSLQIMELISWLEKEFEVTIPAKQVTSDNFRTVAAIAQLVKEAKT